MLRKELGQRDTRCNVGQLTLSAVQRTRCGYNVYMRTPLSRLDLDAQPALGLRQEALVIRPGAVLMAAADNGCPLYCAYALIGPLGALVGASEAGCPAAAIIEKAGPWCSISELPSPAGPLAVTEHRWLALYATGGNLSLVVLGDPAYADPADLNAPWMTGVASLYLDLGDAAGNVLWSVVWSKFPFDAATDPVKGSFGLTNQLTQTTQAPSGFVDLGTKRAVVTQVRFRLLVWYTQHHHVQWTANNNTAGAMYLIPLKDLNYLRQYAEAFADGYSPVPFP